MKLLHLTYSQKNMNRVCKFLGENNIKSKIVGERGGFAIVELKGILEDLKKVIDDGDYGWDGDYEEEWIKDC